MTHLTEKEIAVFSQINTLYGDVVGIIDTSDQWDTTYSSGLTDSDIENAVCEDIDSAYGIVEIAGEWFNPSEIIRSLRPTTLDCLVADYLMDEDQWIEIDGKLHNKANIEPYSLDYALEMDSNGILQILEDPCSGEGISIDLQSNAADVLDGMIDVYLDGAWPFHLYDDRGAVTVDVPQCLKRQLSTWIEDQKSGLCIDNDWMMDVRARYFAGEITYCFGDSQFDTDHRGIWSDACIEPDTDSEDLADTLIDGLIKEILEEAHSVSVQ